MGETTAAVSFAPAPPVGDPSLHTVAEQAGNQSPASAEFIFDEHGSLPDSELLLRWGVSSEEGRQQLTYKGEKLSFAQLLAKPPSGTDGKVCPVGGWFEEAHAIDMQRGDGLSTEVTNAATGMAMMTRQTITVANKPPEVFEKAQATKMAAVAATIAGDRVAADKKKVS